jgi:hypothetical protein
VSLRSPSAGRRKKRLSAKFVRLSVSTLRRFLFINGRITWNIPQQTGTFIIPRSLQNPEMRHSARRYFPSRIVKQSDIEGNFSYAMRDFTEAIEASSPCLYRVSSQEIRASEVHVCLLFDLNHSSMRNISRTFLGESFEFFTVRAGDSRK